MYVKLKDRYVSENLSFHLKKDWDLTVKSNWVLGKIENDAKGAIYVVQNFTSRFMEVLSKAFLS